MRFIVFVILVLGAVCSSRGQDYDDVVFSGKRKSNRVERNYQSNDQPTLNCSLGVSYIPTEWADMASSCVSLVRAQIQKEIDASYQYLALAAHFSKDSVNRPGFANHFFLAAAEEREHAHSLIKYLSMRGELKDSVTGLITTPKGIKKTMWNSGSEAFSFALNLESSVTKSIRSVIVACEKGKNDYHLVDVLTSVYLDEQYKGQRNIAEKLSTLQKMMSEHKEVGEFLFDKML